MKMIGMSKDVDAVAAQKTSSNVFIGQHPKTPFRGNLAGILLEVRGGIVL
jgi:hypothetical protein